MTTVSAQEILRQRGIDYVATRKNKYTTKCPSCGDNYLNVEIKRDGVVWYCQECKEGGGEKFEQQEVKANGDGGLGPVKAIYDYHDEGGTRLFQVLRFEPINSAKQFRQRKDPDQKPWSIKGVRIVPFHLPEIVEAIGEGNVVFVVEGEKDVLTLASHNVTATCNPMGAGKWRDDFDRYFAGADIVLCGDNDRVGRDHMATVAEHLLPVAARVRILDLASIWPGIEQSDDISDWFNEAGGTVERLWQAVEEMPTLVTAPPRANGHDHAEEAAPPPSRWIIRLVEWLERELPLADLTLGGWLSTTSRVLINAPTGLGKTMLGIGLGMRMAANIGFLHWAAVRKATVLFVDGEMSRRQLQKRLREEVKRCGITTDNFYIFSHEDCENFQPLNTPAGQQIIEQVIAMIGHVDFIVFDNIMSLIAGDMKDEESWRQTLPWLKSLTRRSIGQLWMHHTGHDEARGYGTKTREWMMDVVGHLERIERPDTDVSFQFSFRKARDRAPETRRDFSDVRIWLVDDEWHHALIERGTSAPKKKISPAAEKFFVALADTISSSTERLPNGLPVGHIDQWRDLCVKRGLLDKHKPKSASALLSKYRAELVTADRIAVENDLAWIVGASTYQSQMEFGS